MRWGFFTSLKKISIFFSAGIFLCLSIGSITAQEIADRQGVFFADSPFPPYVIGDVGQSPEGGIAVDIVKEACSRIGVSCTIQLYPWKRALRMIETGRSDGTLLLMKNEERSRHILFSELMCTGREKIYYNQDYLPAFTWGTYEGLTEYTIGLVEGHIYGDELMEKIDSLSLKVEYAQNPTINFKKLLAGRIDLIVAEETVASSILERLDPKHERIIGASKPVTEYDYYMGLSKSSRAYRLMPYFNKALEKMKSDGTIEAILRSYEK